jgi:protein-S-isoprenylcysteine O-methyltransferase Ste14
MPIVGWMVVLCGLGLAFSAVDAMRRANISPDPRTPTSAITRSGPYLISRNPIYLGFVAVVIGVPLAFGYYWGIVLAPVAVDAYNRLIIDREELYLKRKFGQEYLDYLAKVRRWL